MERVKIVLDTAEFTGLCELAERELRPIPDQARAIIRERLKRVGLLRQQKEPHSE